MKKETESKIDEILSKYAANQKKEREVEKARNIKKEQFKKDFEESRKSTIIPTLEEIRKRLVAGEFECEIIESEDLADIGSKEKEKRITLRVTPTGKGFGQFDEVQESNLTFIANPKIGSVVLNEKISSLTGGWSETGIGGYNPIEMDADIIEKHVTDFLEKLLKRVLNKD